MKLFKFSGYDIDITEEALLIPAFRKLWDIDKGESKEQARQQLAWVYFMADPRSDYAYIIDEDERSKRIMGDLGMRWKPTENMKTALEMYKSFKTTSALLLEDTRFAVEKLRKMLRDIDLNAVDKNGKPIYTLNSVTSTIKQIPDLVKALDAAEKAMSLEYRNDVKMRGQGEKTVMEDGIV